LGEQEEELDRLNELAENVNEELKSANHILSKVVKEVWISLKIFASVLFD
jgi:hypothetical protein